MSDTFGALSIPLVPPLGGSSAGDPLLSTSLAFFKAILNDQAPAAWNAVYKDTQAGLVVKTTSDDNPALAPFNERDLPALFMWRESADDPVWIADDWLTQSSVCRLMWVMPWAITVKRAVRSSIYNAIARTLLVITERNRDPSWIDDGDADPLAPALGSSFSDRAGWMDFEIGAWKPTQVPIAMQGKGAKPQMYEAISIACAVTERLTIDPTKFSPNLTDQASFTVPDDGTGGGLGPFNVGNQTYT